MVDGQAMNLSCAGTTIVAMPDSPLIDSVNSFHQYGIIVSAKNLHIYRDIEPTASSNSVLAASLFIKLTCAVQQRIGLLPGST